MKPDTIREYLKIKKRPEYSQKIKSIQDL